MATASTAIGPTAYRTFSPKLAPTLTALGALLTIAGGLGTWIRATEIQAEGGDPIEVARVMGFSEGEGWGLAALGLAALVAALTWSVRSLLPKAAPILASAALVGFIGWRLSVLDQRAATMADQARAAPDFFSFHAGFGWGAWLMLFAAVLLGLSIVVGVLRELDLRTRGSV
ncbi:MAG: hypothetical protein ACRDH6_05555 [Actinomycetota bacterium]